MKDMCCSYRRDKLSARSKCTLYCRCSGGGLEFLTPSSSSRYPPLCGENGRYSPPVVMFGDQGDTGQVSHHQTDSCLTSLSRSSSQWRPSRQGHSGSSTTASLPSQRWPEPAKWRGKVADINPFLLRLFFLMKSCKIFTVKFHQFSLLICCISPAGWAWMFSNFKVCVWAKFLWFRLRVQLWGLHNQVLLGLLPWPPGNISTALPLPLSSPPSQSAA